MAMQEIGKISLKNSGGFVAKMQLNYTDDDGNRKRTGKSGDIPLGQSLTVDPGDVGVPDGSTVSLFAFVALGKDNEATKSFKYKKGSSYTAKYNISGTTLNNDLGLIGVE